MLNPKMQFTLVYIDSTDSHKEIFNYSDKSKEFVSDKGNSLDTYFKQRFKTQVKIARDFVRAKCFVEVLKTLDKTKKVSSYVIKPAFCLFIPALLTAIFTRGTVVGDISTGIATAMEICMLVGIVTVVYLGVYAATCNSKIDDPNAENVNYHHAK